MKHFFKGLLVFFIFLVVIVAIPLGLNVLFRFLLYATGWLPNGMQEMCWGTMARYWVALYRSSYSI